MSTERPPSPFDVEIARSLDTAPELLEWVPDLLEGMECLGCGLEEILELVEVSGLEPGARILDIPSGKGAVSLALAERGFELEGVDLFRPFLEHAGRLARERGLEEKVRFLQADMREHLRASRERFDLVVYAACGTLGPLDRAVEELRRAVRPGGFVLIDDGYLGETADNNLEIAQRQGWQHYAPYEQTIERLTASGDRLVAERTSDDDDDDDDDEPDALDSDMALMRARAAALLRELDDSDPRSRETIEAVQRFLRLQEEETEALKGYLEPATWLLERR